MSKPGRLSREDEEYILANAGKMTPKEIAEKINRTVEPVKKFIRFHVKPREMIQKGIPIDDKDAERITIRQELRNSVKWARMKEELTKDELKFFEEEYISLMAQFRNDVLATEENQIFDAIKFEVLKTRNMIARRRALDDIERLEKVQADHIGQFASPADMNEKEKDYALQLENQLNIARSNEVARTNEYVKLQERVDKLMQSLKATRDQRVAKIESAKINFIGVIKLLQQKDVQEQEGRQIGLMQLAAEKEYERLGRPHKFEDGNEDSPILSADTVDLGPEEEDG